MTVASMVAAANAVPVRTIREGIIVMGGKGFVKNTPKVITFDAYNCLYTTTMPVMEQYSLVGRKHGVNVCAGVLNERFAKIFRGMHERYPNYGKHSNITVERWWQLFIGNLFAPAEVPKAMVDDIMKRFEGTEAYVVNCDLRFFLENVRANYPDVIFAIISNTDPLIHKLLDNLDVSKYFGENVFLSYDLDCRKPDKRIYDKALDSILKRNNKLLSRDGITSIEELKQRCWHIGDEEVNDMRGASNAGWNGLLLDRSDRYGYFGTRVERDEDALYNDKIVTHIEDDWECIKRKSAVVKVSDSQYAVQNFYSAARLLFPDMIERIEQHC